MNIAIVTEPITSYIGRAQLVSCLRLQGVRLHGCPATNPWFLYQQMKQSMWLHIYQAWGQFLSTTSYRGFSWIAKSPDAWELIIRRLTLTMKTSPTYIQRTRPIVLRWQYAREQDEKGRIMRQKVKGDDNQPEIFTKPLDGITFGFYFVYPE